VSSDQGKTYLAFIEGELKVERERRSTYDARGQALITTSGTLVTLLAGFAALVKTATTATLSSWTLVAFALAVTLFIGAAGCGILAGWNRYYAVAKTKTLQRMLDDHWIDDEIDARNNVATLQLITVDTLRKANAFKATCVTVGLIVQVFALVALGGAVVMVVVRF
jgi:hypothetical protein